MSALITHTFFDLVWEELVMEGVVVVVATSLQCLCQVQESVFPVVHAARCINTYSLQLQSRSIILNKHTHQHIWRLVWGVCVCVFLIGREELNCSALWDSDVRFACTHPPAWKEAVCMTKGGRVTLLMTFTHLACGAMRRRRISFELRHRSFSFYRRFFYSFLLIPLSLWSPLF